MNDPFHYYTIEKPAVAEFRDRGSKFIAYSYPVTTVTGFKEKLAALKKEHPKAAHHCFAYRIGTGGNIFRVSDDGEPAGSAGRPVLGQIDSKQLTNVLIVVVRYFGGTLLGVPGLIHAYKTVANESLPPAIIIRRPVLITYRLEFDYTHMNEIMKLVKQFDCVIIKQENQLFSSIEIGVPAMQEKNFLGKTGDLHAVVIHKQ